MAEKQFPISGVLATLRKEVKTFKPPLVGQYSHSPFLVFISTLLSLRTKDDVTGPVCEELFKVVNTPEGFRDIPQNKLEALIRRVGFYKTKANTLKNASTILLEQHGGKVPNSLESLLAIKGVGRKTANLTITMGYGTAGICVDIHVHRITNRWGYLKSKAADDTEMILRKILPKKHWIEINDILVAYGQNICKPVSPFCSKCKIEKFCKKIDVTKTR